MIYFYNLFASSLFLYILLSCFVSKNGFSNRYNQYNLISDRVLATLIFDCFGTVMQQVIIIVYPTFYLWSWLMKTNLDKPFLQL